MSKKNQNKIIFYILTLMMVFTFLSKTWAVDAPLVKYKYIEVKPYHYSIHYPNTLTYSDHGDGMVTFKGKVGVPPSPMFVNIQTIYTKNHTGKYATVKDLMDDFTTQVPRNNPEANFLERKPITLVEPDGTKLKGEQTILTFTEKKVLLKQWQIMVMNQNGTMFQAWAYRAPLKYFDINRPIALAMLASWEIH